MSHETTETAEFEFADLQVAKRVGDLAGETDAVARTALAAATRAVRLGSVCVDLAVLGIPTDVVASSQLVARGVLRLEGDLAYLDRYHRLESAVAADLTERLSRPMLTVDEDLVESTLASFGDHHFSDEQQEAARRAARANTLVLTGGPGTGKTTTVARILTLLAAVAPGGRQPSVALAAPTGRAAARLAEAVAEDYAGPVESMTLHRLLGFRPDNRTRFRHHRGNRLSWDVVVVDEASMMDLTMMARLTEALRPETRLLLVGDPNQLTSVGAGAVLADLVDGLPDPAIAALTENHRSTRQINRLAEALRLGSTDEVLAILRDPAGAGEVDFVETDAPADAIRAATLPHALELVRDPRVESLGAHRLLCAHRTGPFGVEWWNRRVEEWLAESTGLPLRRPWYAGQPLLVTRNEHTLNLFNGDTGVVTVRDGRLRALVATGAGVRELAPSRLGVVETMHASTIHKAQGSQAEEVTVLLPDPESRLLSRELFYTAVTRAQRHLRVIGTEDAVRAAVAQTADRATGLADRLKPVGYAADPSEP